MPLQELFNAAADKVRSFTKRPTDQELLEIYALYKQATIGDNATAKPSMLDFKGQAKWDAWLAKKGMCVDVAKENYIQLVNRLSKSYS